MPARAAEAVHAQGTAEEGGCSKQGAQLEAATGSRSKALPWPNTALQAKALSLGGLGRRDEAPQVALLKHSRRGCGAPSGGGRKRSREHLRDGDRTSAGEPTSLQWRALSTALI
eukprot:3089685-Alexandrium_andersonii.AAC.1